MGYLCRAVENRPGWARVKPPIWGWETQIMNLLHLAPDIQEEILFLPEVTEGRDPIHEHMLRPLFAEMGREKRRQWWAVMREQVSDAPERIPDGAT